MEENFTAGTEGGEAVEIDYENDPLLLLIAQALIEKILGE